MATDLQSWLAPNRIYDGLPSALKHAMENEEVYIVTTKQVMPCFSDGCFWFSLMCLCIHSISVGLQFLREEYCKFGFVA